MEGTAPFPGLLHFTFDTYLIMLSAKQGGIKYHFLSLWYDPTSVPDHWGTLYSLGQWTSKVKLATLVKGDSKAPFSIATTRRCKGGSNSFPGLFHFTLDAYLIMQSAKQGGIKYHFLSLWYDLTGDWTLVSKTIGEYFTH